MTGAERREQISAEIAARTGITEAMIERLVHAFYDKVRADDVLAPVFNARIQDWTPHLAQMCAFWSSVALMTGRYHGTPMVKHMPLPVDAAHFDRWLALFEQTAHEICPGEAEAQGVNVRRIKISCFALSGVLAGFAGVLLFSQFKTVRIATGAGEELKAIAGAVVGGTLLAGGSGSVIGALLGVLIISMLRTGVVLTNLIPADNFEAIVGATIVGAAIFNSWIRKQS